MEVVVAVGWLVGERERGGHLITREIPNVVSRVCTNCPGNANDEGIHSLGCGSNIICGD